MLCGKAMVSGSCMDAVYCVLVSIGLFLELNLSRTNPSTTLLPFLLCFCNDITVPGARGSENKRDCTE